MLVQFVFEIFYLALIALIISFIILFYAFSRKPPKRQNTVTELNGGAKEADSKHGMERKERSWLYFLLAVVLLGNLVTLSPLIPSANYGMWTQSNPVKTITIQVENHYFIMP